MGINCDIYQNCKFHDLPEQGFLCLGVAISVIIKVKMHHF